MTHGIQAALTVRVKIKLFQKAKFKPNEKNKLK